MADFTIKTGDTSPPIVAILKDATSTVVNVSGTTIRFILKNKLTGTVAVDAVATIVDGAAGKVEYGWATGDTDVAGTYRGEFEVHWNDGTFETFPNATYIAVKIISDLGGSV